MKQWLDRLRARITPYTQPGLVQYDHLEPMEAAFRAWTRPGANPHWHAWAQDDVRRAMPLLARALDRAAKEKDPKRWT